MGQAVIQARAVTKWSGETTALPVPESATVTYAGIPSLNAIDDHAYPKFDLGIPDQYRTDVWLQSFEQSEKTGNLANLNLIWMPDDHTAGVGSGDPNPVAEVADNDLAVGRIIDTISHSKFWKDSAVFVVEDDTQDGADHVDGHRGPLLVGSPYAARRRERHLLQPDQRGADDRADPRLRAHEPGGPRRRADVLRVHQQAGLRLVHRRPRDDPADAGPDGVWHGGVGGPARGAGVRAVGG